MISQRTCIRAGDDDNFPCQIRDIIYFELALGREYLWDDWINNAHGSFKERYWGKEWTLHNNLRIRNASVV